MLRIESRPFVAVGLSLAILGYVGCTRIVETSPPGGTSRRVDAGASKVDGLADANAKLFADWRGLQGALAITGEMFGYLEPCGCTEGQLGGLGRRYDLFERMAAQKIPFARVDLGSLTKDPAAARGGLEEAKIKFDAALKALGSMKYDALALAPEDLKLGIAHTLSVYLNLNQKDGPKVVSANAVPSGDVKEAFADVIRDSTIAQAGPYKVGITAVLDPAEYGQVKDPDRAMLEVKPPESVLGDVLKRLEAASDVQVLMVQGPPELAKSLGEAFPGFDVVVATCAYDDPDGNPTMLNGGATQLVSVGHKGKYVGVIGLFAGTKGKAPEARYQKVTLNHLRYQNAEPMRVLIDEEMQGQLRSLGVVENYPRHGNADAPAGATYVGAEGCKSCHPNTYLRWAGTNHAHAFDILVNNPKEPKRRREFDAECISCHTTGFTYTSGWASAEKTPYLKGNQCENCHGPASKHVEQPENKEFLAALHRTAESADKGGLCHKCHDPDNSPKFNFGTYYGKVAHKGMDQYTDPRVRKGMTPEQARLAK